MRFGFTVMDLTNTPGVYLILVHLRWWRLFFFTNGSFTLLKQRLSFLLHTHRNANKTVSEYRSVTKQCHLRQFT